jgi:crotonobetainyl-CoA:carnitine CoA-transferase CaiB-like acyl-CoA transferase
VALLDAQIAWLANVAQNYLATGEPPGRYGNAHPSIVPYESFPTADGAWRSASARTRNIASYASPPDARIWPTTNASRTNAGRVDPPRRADPAAAARSSVHAATGMWLELFNALGVPAGEINDVAQALERPAGAGARRWCRRWNTRLRAHQGARTRSQVLAQRTSGRRAAAAGP